MPEVFSRTHCRSARWSAVALAGTAALLLLTSVPLCAASYTWGASSGDWSLASTWGGTVPTIDDNAYVVNSGSMTITTSAACANLTLDNPATATILMTSGNLTTGRLDTENVGSEFIGYSAAGNFMQSGGINTVQQYVPFFSCYGLCLGYNAGSSGNYTLSGTGQLQLPGRAYGSYLRVGYSGSGSFTQSGGIVNITDNNYPTVEIAQNAGSVGTYSLSGGQLNVLGQALPGGENVGASGTGAFTQSGGTNNMTGGITLGQNSGSSGTYNLNGGLLRLSGLAAGSGSAAFNFSGGTFQAVSSLSTSLSMTLSGTANFDPAGNTMTLSGLLSGPGRLAKLGSGTAILTAANTYSGGTAIGSGTLQLGTGASGQDGSLGSTSGVTDNGTLAYDLYGSQNINFAISGSGGLVCNGPGTVVLSNSNSFTGDTRISAGTVSITHPAALAGSTLDMNLADSGTLNLNGLSPTLGGLKGGRDLAIPANQTLTLGVNNLPATYSGVLSGSAPALPRSAAACRSSPPRTRFLARS